MDQIPALGVVTYSFRIKDALLYTNDIKYIKQESKCQKVLAT